MTFASKKDAWLMAIIYISAAALFASAFSLLLTGFSLGTLVLLACLVLAGVGTLWCGHVLYTLTDSELLVKAGPFKWRIALNAIREVSPSKNPLSSPALSLDRLLIDYGQGNSLLISPADRDKFIQALVTRAPKIKARTVGVG